MENPIFLIHWPRNLPANYN